MRKLLGPIVALAASALVLLAGVPAASAADYPPPPPTPIAITITGLGPTGGTVTITLSGLQPGMLVIISVASTPQEIGSAVVDANGNLNTALTLPPLEAGTHTIFVREAATGKLLASQTFEVTAEQAATTPGGTKPVTPTTPTKPGGGLAVTGAAVGSLVLLAVCLLVAGTIVLVSGKRRRSESTSA
ncbi:MAG: hypothetical protein LBQ06_05225 [Frankiaceae bacterium]|jgi:hypothetical protein|nr:hypothetical protein [Frankiaceae bacterium]